MLNKVGVLLFVLLFVGDRPELIFRHPLRADFRLVQRDQMVFAAQFCPSTKVGRTPTGAMLFKHGIHTTQRKFRQQRIGGIKSVTQKDVAHFKGIEHGSQEGLFAAAFAFEFPHGRIQRSATG